MRAIRTESAAALKWWWRVSTHTAWSVAEGVRRRPARHQGSRALHEATSLKGGAAAREREIPDGEIDQRTATRRARGGWTMPNRWKDAGWTAEQMALLGTHARLCRGGDDRPDPECGPGMSSAKGRPSVWRRLSYRPGTGEASDAYHAASQKTFWPLAEAITHTLATSPPGTIANGRNTVSPADNSKPSVPSALLAVTAAERPT